MSEINTEFTIYFDDTEMLDVIHKGMSIAYDGDKAASDRYFLEIDIPIWPGGHDNWDLVEYTRDNGCLRGIINSGTISFDEEEFLQNLAYSGSKYLLANVHNSQVDEKYVIAYIEKKKTRASTVIKELSQIDPTIALSIAIEKNRVKESVALLEQGANPDGSVAGKPFICIAAENESPSVLKALLEAGADLNAQNPVRGGDDWKDPLSGYTALHYAASAYSDRMTKLLLKHGADVNIKNNDGQTPIYIAVCGSDHAGNTKHLLEAGTDLQIYDEDGRTPLLSMLESYSEEDSKVPIAIKVLEMFLQHGSDPKEVCSRGGNAIWYASHSQELIDHLHTLGITELLAPDGAYNSNILSNLVTAIRHDDQKFFFSQADAFDALSPNDKISLLNQTVWYNRFVIAEWLLEHGVSPVAVYIERRNTANPSTIHSKITAIVKLPAPPCFVSSAGILNI